MAQRYFIKLAFDGSHYHGWQQQPNALSIEHMVGEAVCTILRHNVSVTGCGRTDTGVHAREFYAHFDTEPIIENEENTVYKLNGVLPDDIAIQRLIKVKPDAHARFSALRRTYQYFINANRSPFDNKYSYFYYKNLDIALMNETCLILKSFRNFSCFAKSHTQVKNFLCTIHEATWVNEDGRHIFTITANRFLRNMVRAIVGTMLDVGTHKISPEDFRTIIEKGTRSDAGMSVPAKGLFLTAVEYPEDIFYKNNI
ncbi:MAG TPA: tRNA pseudouridine(38-40) synthase TruA [Bacteroidales bacterium]|nr:tRNA pseudouridine(38-40) synthase TruA [Bacteroidales bacterium]